MAAVGEVLAGVVEDVVGAEGAHEVELRGAGHAGDLRPGGLGELDGVAAHAAGRADDEHLLPCPDAPGIEALQRGARRDRHRGGLREGEVPGLAGQLALLGDGVLGEAALPGAVDLVADGEPGHLRPDGDHRAGEVHPQHGVPRPTDPEGEAAEVGQPRHEVDDAAVEAGRAHLDEHLAVADVGTRELGQADDVGRAVLLSNGRPHADLPVGGIGRGLCGR